NKQTPVPLRASREPVASQLVSVHCDLPDAARFTSIVLSLSFHRGKPLRSTLIASVGLPFAYRNCSSTTLLTPSTPRSHAATSRLLTGTPGWRGVGPTIASRFLSSSAIAFFTVSRLRP